MNFLAHLFLSCSDEYLMIGNFAADFLKNQDLVKLPLVYHPGISLHRSIDSFTDKHPEVRACNKLLYPTQGKYAPVVTDILFDYFLHTNWHLYSEEKYTEFTHRVYDILQDHKHKLPGKLPDLVRRMVEDQFLDKYITIDGLDLTFTRVQSRLRFPSSMDQATQDMQVHFTEFNKRFNLFFPEVIKRVNNLCAC